MFGPNIATDQLTLARALLALRPGSEQMVTLDELAAPFSDQICITSSGRRKGNVRFSRTGF